MAHALIVEDDTDAARLVAALVAGEGFSTACASTLVDARRQLALQPADLLLIDLQLPDGSGMELLDDPDLPGAPAVVLMTGHPRLPSALRAWRHGALDYLVKPFELAQLRESVARRGRGMRPARHTEEAGKVGEAGEAGVTGKGGAKSPPGGLGLLVGSSAPMQAVYRQIARVAPTHIAVLVTGESGTGKELVARTLHDMSPRRERPFVAVNCGALSPHLAESELFGHERGSFTGAERQHAGFFEQAAGGTLFLDEVTEMPLPMQVKLLRVLESGVFMRVGGTGSQQADVRVVSACNREPARAVRDHLLREDLFWRLNVFPIELPPLRARLEDLPALSLHLLAQIARREGQLRAVDAEGLAQLASHDWPGNVRELRNVLQRAWVMAEGPQLPPELLAAACGQKPAAPARARGTAEPGPGLHLPLGISLADAERRLIEATLLHLGQQREQAAATLGISHKTLYNRLRAYGKPAGL